MRSIVYILATSTQDRDRYGNGSLGSGGNTYCIAVMHLNAR